MTFIKLENISYKYRGKIPAIKDLSLNITENEVIGLIGPNGAGKSTLAKLFAGFIRPTSGQMFLDGKNYKKLSIYDISKEIGYLFQNSDVMLCTSSVFDEISISLKRKNLPEDEINNITTQILRFLDLYIYQKFHPRRLSQGEKRRVNLGFILASNPKVIILDEPFAGLDYNRKDNLLLYLKKLKKDHTIILISHDIDTILDFCNRVIILNEGRLVFDDNVEKLKNNLEKLTEVGLKPPSILNLFHQFKSLGLIPSNLTNENLINFLKEKIRYAN